ncbi:Lrp/AsnC family transcriptional regulator [Yinghuangia aomiensis]
MNAGLDDIDRKIIAILQADGRRACSQIAEDLGIPASSVRYRVQRGWRTTASSRSSASPIR